MKKTYRKIATAICAASLAVCGLAGCAQQPEQSADEQQAPAIDVTDLSEGVAATVNGVEIGEKAVNDYIDNFRQTNSLTDDAAWGSYMGQNGYTPESLRQVVVDSFVEQEVVRQAAEENGIEVTDEDIEKALEQAKESAGNESSWRIMLKYSGMTEDQYRDSLRQQLMQRGLFYKATGTSELDSLVNQITSTMREQGGSELADLIDRAAAKMDEAMEVQKVKADDELLLSLIRLYESDYAEAASLDDIPSDVVAAYRVQADSAVQSQAFSELMQSYLDTAEVHTNDMPADAVYNVEVIEGSAETADDAQAAEAAPAEEQPAAE